MSPQLSYLIAPSSTPIPAQAAAVGYNIKTFDSSTLSNAVGGMYCPASFYGLKGAYAHQDKDGTFEITDMRQTLVCTAKLNPDSPGQFEGIAFGGGAYFETIASWNPGNGVAGAAWPAIWFNDVENMAYNRVWAGNLWPGLTALVTAGNANIQLNFPTAENYTVGNRIVFAGALGTVTGLAIDQTYYIVAVGAETVQVSLRKGGRAIVPGGTGACTLTVMYGTWIELDCEYDSGKTNCLGYTLISWNGYVGDNHKTHETWHAFPVIEAGNSFANPNKFGMLWVPATETTQGYATFYFNDVAITSAYWDLYDPTLQPPPVRGTSAYSIIDKRHLVPVLDTSAVYAMTISSMKVWQADVSGNLVNP